MPARPSPVRFGVVGVDHDHINGMTEVLLDAGARPVAFYSADSELAGQYAARFRLIRRASSIAEILGDDSIHIVATAGIPAERGPLGVSAMRHGKDFFSDKPAFTTLDQLAEARRVQSETSRLYAIDYSERLHNRAMVKAAELVGAGAIGRVLQTVGLGPHRLRAHKRPDWFFQRERYGGILTDIGAHQADHFLHFTGSTKFEIVASQVGNLAHPETPELEDFGDALVRGDGGSGYFRLDWFTPDGWASGATGV